MTSWRCNAPIKVLLTYLAGSSVNEGEKLFEVNVISRSLQKIVVLRIVVYFSIFFYMIKWPGSFFGVTPSGPDFFSYRLLTITLLSIEHNNNSECED